MKQKIDDFINSNYNKLINIAKKKIRYYNRPTSPEAILNDAYIYVIKNPPEIESDIPRYIVNYINMEIRFQMSSVTKRDKLSSTLFIDKVCDSTLQEQIELTDCLESFRNTLPRIEQIVWDVYSKKGKWTIREISEHFNINMTSANFYRKGVLTKFKNYYENQN